MALYDSIGKNYTVNRCTEPRIAAQIFDALGEAPSLLNIGAGSGSYEPEHSNLVAVEPSVEMTSQRTNPGKVVRAFAEELPFSDNAFTHTMTVLSIHHWRDRARGFAEVNRVTTKKFIALTWMPDAGSFWLTRDYFPEIFEMDQAHFPTVDELSKHFDDVKSEVVPIPADCKDGFLAAFWKRPDAYLQPAVRQSISSFSKLNRVEERIEKLREDILSGKWNKRNHAILDKASLDLGYRLVTAKIKKNS